MAATQRDYYEILGVTKAATQEEIKKAYKKLALANHPDRNPGDQEAVARFKEAAEAYEILSDDDTRARYDRFGHAGVKGAAGRHQFHDVQDIFDVFGDLFEGFGLFGGRSRNRHGGPQRGAHLQTALTIDLATAAKGCQREIEVRRTKSCTRCSGSGAEPGSSPETCHYCGGHGQVVQAQGFFRIQTTCPACRGAGKIVRNKCTTCGGAGREDETATLSVRVPPGMDDGMQLRVPGEGEAGAYGGPRGDLFVNIRVKEHPLFHREGKHLGCRVPISYTQAALGTTLDIPLLDASQESLHVPAGTPSGEVFRLRGKGMPDPHGGRPGDLHIEVELVVPRKLSEEHEALLRQLAELEKTEVNPHEKSWFEKLKDLISGDASSS
jgi:molecular chaperone DnaJ